MINKKFKAEWDKVADWWNEETDDTGVWHQRTEIDPVMFEILGEVKGKKVLEIGCGNGYFARRLARQGAKVTATDISTKMLNFAVAKENVQPLGIKYLLADAANLRAFKNKSFAIVVANMCLMDITNAAATIREVSRVLKNKGRFIFSITHPVFACQPWALMREKNKQYFGRIIIRYLIPSKEKHVLWASGIPVSQFQRPIQEYVQYLHQANFLIKDLREIPTIKRLKKTKRGDKDIKTRLSRYSTEAEKLMKLKARKEIPYFLVVEAVKSSKN